MPAQRGYRQGCGIARGLDIVGERWSLLVVRELLLGPKRFTDLQQALPSASPNALSDRLRELTGAGVIVRRALPMPAGVRVYELTTWGRELEPIVLALGTWALAAPATPEQRFVSADSAMLTIRTYARPAPGRPAATLRIELRDHGPAGTFGVRLTADGAEIIREPLDSPDVTVITTTDALLSAFGHGPAVPGSVTTGDPEAVRHLLAAVQIKPSEDDSAYDRSARDPH
ncbi:HxlR family transcriptional regulator [Actinoplanes cyaneus]|uniref:HxlR family transcriptional regulator n=1 Tax=Actinoplanes cyaneus TaxID=52696 RepID=A0A919ITR3_9ACTN|nr:helix-turn-helix domain-containing protein [Actinoplanes cyaneus]MCW2139826.1 transcriptional regulator, HxlR family [Actinoplanes cyaneus]GID67885.1 HxlR family transcriptional regulator [Actinoplanes cyaneus]